MPSFIGKIELHDASQGLGIVHQDNGINDFILNLLVVSHDKLTHVRADDFRLFLTVAVCLSDGFTERRRHIIDTWQTMRIGKAVVFLASFQ